MKPPEAGPPDAVPTNVGPPEAGPPDAVPTYVGPPDAGPPDAGPTDAGPPGAHFTNAVFLLMQGPLRMKPYLLHTY